MTWEGDRETRQRDRERKAQQCEVVANLVAYWVRVVAFWVPSCPIPALQGAHRCNKHLHARGEGRWNERARSSNSESVRIQASNAVATWQAPRRFPGRLRGRRGGRGRGGCTAESGTVNCVAQPRGNDVEFGRARNRTVYCVEALGPGSTRHRRTA